MEPDKIKELLGVADLVGAIDAVTQQVKTKPMDTGLRTTLFELLCFAGEFDRAGKQLDVLEQQRPQRDLGVQVYRNCLKAERERQRLYAQGTHPHFLNEPPAYVDLQLEAFSHCCSGNYAETRSLLDKAEEERPALTGKFNGNPFRDFRDTDDFTGAVLEAVVHDKYTWIPFEQIRRLEVTSPKNLRDILWATARLESIKGVQGEVLLPALYTGTSKHPNGQVRLGRMTDWNKLNEDLYQAVGLRTFLVDDQDHSIFEAKSIEFEISPTQTH